MSPLAPAVSPGEKRAVVMILAALAVLQIYGAWRTGITIDEPSHLLSSYLYWRGADRLPPSDMPPLIKIASGWAPNLFSLPVPGDLGHEGDTRHEWHVSSAITDNLPAHTLRRLFFTARLPVLMFPALAGFLLWKWAREIYSPLTALVVLLLFVLEPTALAHGSLFKNDLAATFGYLLFWRQAWCYWRQPGSKSAAWLGFAALLACMAKLSALVVLPMAPAVILLRWAQDRRSGCRAVALSLLLALAVPYAGLLAAYQFDARRLRGSYLGALASDPAMPKTFVAVSHVFRVFPIPTNLWRGTVSLLSDDAKPATVYMNGKVWPSGHPLYFVFALLVKVPAAVQLLVLGGIALLAVRMLRRRLAAEDWFWILPGFLWIFLASLSRLQLGVRLILPALPFGLLLAGAAVERLIVGRWKYVLAVLVLLAGVESLRVYPHGIAFFNIWAGGPENGLRYLADSNLDWGQSVPDLVRYVKRNQIEHFRFAYFGADNPRNYFSERQMEMIAPPWEDKWIRGTEYRPEPGVYAVSATLLPGHFFRPQYRRYFHAFWERRPVARVGYSIYIYRME